MSFEIEGRRVGGGARCLVIAEVAQAHDGSLETAREFVDAAADAGADAVKFQTHIAAAESTAAEPFRVPTSRDRTRFDYWKRMEWSSGQWAELAAHARTKGLAFLSSPFSVEAVDLLATVEMSAWKVPSGEITNGPLLDRMLATKRPILLSTGMCTLAELDRAVERVRRARADFLIFQCTSAYPCPPEQLGLNVLGVFAERYACPVGLSDHSGTPAAGLAAAALGAAMIEVHLKLTPEGFGPDASSSLTPAQLRQLVDGVRFLHAARTHPVDKDALAAELAPLRAIFMKGVFAARDLPEDHVLQPADLALKKPALGLRAEELERAFGRRLARAVAKDQPVAAEDLK